MSSAPVMPPSASPRLRGEEPAPAKAAQGEVLVRVEGVSKKFCRDLKKSLWYGVRDMVHEFNPLSKKPTAKGQSLYLRPGEFWANKDISFELRRGECIGLIGRNGAGKTTLLKMLNGLIKPDAGRIEMRGRVGALIALGAGFNPILSGRENIYVNGSVLGLSRAEIDSKVDDIIEFADITEFIDAPVQSYSSGMQVRLGFAVATALNPDVLILDEVLAVGDAAFRMKCYNRIAELQKQAAIIFVSHAMEQVAQVCNRVLVLKRGTPLFVGEVERGVAIYDAENTSSDEDAGFERTAAPVESGSVSLPEERVGFNTPCKISLRLSCAAPLARAVVRIQFYNQQGTAVTEFIASEDRHLVDLLPGDNVIEIELAPLNLKRGKYLLSVLVYDQKRLSVHFWSYKECILYMDSPAAFAAQHLASCRSCVVRHDA